MKNRSEAEAKKIKEWEDKEEEKRQKRVKQFGIKIKTYELCSTCGGTGTVHFFYGESWSCRYCNNGKVIKLVPFL